MLTAQTDFPGNAVTVANILHTWAVGLLTSPTDVSIVGNPDFHSKQLKVTVKFPLQDSAKKPQASSYTDIYNTQTVHQVW